METLYRAVSVGTCVVDKSTDLSAGRSSIMPSACLSIIGFTDTPLWSLEQYP